MFERFSLSARESVLHAQTVARELRHPMIGSEHVLLGILGDMGSLSHRLLESFAVDPIRLRNDLRGRLRASA